MRSLLFVIALLFASQSALAGNIEDAVKDFRIAYAAAMEAGDADAAASALAEDGYVMPEFQKALIGKDNARAYYAAFFERFEIAHYKKKSAEVIDLGPVQADIGSFKARMTHKASGKLYDIEGTYFDVWKEADGGAALTDQSWNYDAPYEGLRTDVQFPEMGEHLAFTPHLQVTDDVSFDLTALAALNDAAMMRGQADFLYLAYGEDAVMAPHDAPPVKGREGVRAFLEHYTASWPPFHFVKSGPHSVHVHEDMALTRLSYILRWDGGAVSGVSLGKGLRIMKRDENGSYRVYRLISLHDQ